MPRYDGTGPQGEGPMTGRGSGYCFEGQAKGSTPPIGGGGYNFRLSRFRRGLGGGLGLGRGRRFGRGCGAGRGIRRRRRF